MVVNGSIWMYAEVIVANDYGPLELFTAETAAGPCEMPTTFGTFC